MMNDKWPSKDVEDIYELSPIQQGLLFEQLAQPGIGIYIEQLRLEFEGVLDPSMFEQAWQRVVDRHPILRTSFHWRNNGTIMQVVHRTAQLPLEVLDWRELADEEQQERLGSWLGRERAEGFNLTAAPLMRSTLIRRGERVWTFAWRFSHLLMDGWSFTLAIQNFIDNYRALCRDVKPTDVHFRPYRDYLAWWRARDTQQARDFWESELADYEPPEQLGMGGSAVPEGDPTHSFFEFQLTDLAPKLREIARAEQLTLATLAQGAWFIVLGRYYGRDDVACGITMAHRPNDLPGADTVLGPMIATLPLRERLERSRALRSWLRDFGRHVTEVSRNTAIPLTEVQSAFGRGNTAPLLQSSVSYENVPMPDFALEDVGAAMTGLSYDGRPHYPITMVIMPGDDMPLRVMYDRRKFSDTVARGIADDLVAVLLQIVERPELTLGELEMSGENGATGRTPCVRGEPECLHETYERQAARTPDAVAATCADRSLTYRELGRYSDAIAAALGERARDSAVVGVCLERSVEFVATVLGTFKAGAAYVPLDPTYPSDRLADMLADSGAGVVVTMAELADRLPEHIEHLRIDADVPDEPAAAPEDMRVRNDPEAPAYLLYTSGSTGRPKGVVVTHRNVQSLLAAGREHFGFTSQDVYTAAHSPAFDYSVWEMWNALGNGGRLVVVPPRTSRDPRALERLVREERVTVLSQTPAMFEHFVAEMDDEQPALRQVFLGGDRLDASILWPWFDRFGGTEITLYNLYGVTEASVVSTWCPIRSESLREATTLPIGFALANQRTYLLDNHDKQVPLGATGELCVAGPAVAARYHARPELTAERFGVDPFVAGESMYRTGDLARQGADGALQFLGRADTQVKVRGFRVELGEIEAALRQHPAVRSATVVVQGKGGAARVIGYAVPADPAGEAGTADGQPADDLRAFITATLPDHMVPSAVIWVGTIPTTSRGKIDTAALPAVEMPRTADFVAPRTDRESDISTAVAGTLGVERVGVFDRVDELGLHSIDAMRLMARLRSEHSLEVQLPELLDSPTVAVLAQVAVQVRPSAARMEEKR